jgi:hypothetical protein
VTLPAPVLGDAEQLTDLSIVAASADSINVNCEDNARNEIAIALNLKLLPRNPCPRKPKALRFVPEFISAP